MIFVICLPPRCSIRSRAPLPCLVPLQADLENKQIDLINDFSTELKRVQDMFTENRFRSYEGKFCERDGPPIFVNMPPIAGALAWVQGLMSRLEEPMKSLQPVFVKLSHMDEVKDVITMHASIATHGTRHHISRASVPTPLSPAASLGRHASARRRGHVSRAPAATRLSTVCASSQLDLSELTALGPLDGRYAAKTASLRPFFSEYVVGLPVGPPCLSRCPVS